MSSKVFRSVLCATTLIFVQSGAFGMEKAIDPAHEIGESVTITDRAQLLSITPEQAKKIKSLRIENQVIDSDFYSFLLSLNRLDSLCFYRCGNIDDVFEYVEHSDVVRLLDCSLTSSDATWCLSSILCWGHVKILDLTNNGIGNEPDLFFRWLKTHLWGGLCIDKIVLSDNKFTEDDRHKALLYFGGYPQIVI